jgi:hypothetical protein
VPELNLTLLEQPICIRSDDPRWIEVFRALWEPFVTPNRAGLVMEISDRRAASDGRRTKDGGWELTYPGESPILARDPWSILLPARWFLIRSALKGSAGIVGLHAGAVARGSEALLLAGPGGAGKTTTILDLVREGWEYLTDDVVPFAARTGAALTFPKPAAVKDPARWRNGAPAWELPGWLPPPQGAFLIPASSIGTLQEGSYGVRRIVFLKYLPAAGSRIEEISGGRALALSGQGLHPVTAPSLGTLGRALKGARAYKMTYDSSATALRLLRGITDGE